MQVKDQFVGSWALYLSLQHVMSSCVHLLFINRICLNITMPERFYTMYEKCKFLSMGCISALTKATVC